MNNEVQAAITMALYEAMGYTMHDAESGNLTIEHKETPWVTPKLIVLSR